MSSRLAAATQGVKKRLAERFVGQAGQRARKGMGQVGDGTRLIGQGLIANVCQRTDQAISIGEIHGAVFPAAQKLVRTHHIVQAVQGHQRGPVRRFTRFRLFCSSDDQMVCFSDQLQVIVLRFAVLEGLHRPRQSGDGAVEVIGLFTINRALSGSPKQRGKLIGGPGELLDETEVGHPGAAGQRMQGAHHGVVDLHARTIAGRIQHRQM